MRGRPGLAAPGQHAHLRRLRGERCSRAILQAAARGPARALPWLMLWWPDTRAWKRGSGNEGLETRVWKRGSENVHAHLEGQ